MMDKGITAAPIRTITVFDASAASAPTSNLDRLETLCRQSNMYAWANREITVAAPPALMYITITNACNHKCKVCAWKDTMRRGRNENGEKQMGLMSYEMFQRCVDMIPDGVARVYLQKTGESTLNPDLPRMMKYIKTQRPEIEVAMHTNGTRLDDPEIVESILNYLDFFSISFFGIDRETYNTAHGKKDYDLVLNNASRFYETYQKSFRKPRVFFDYVGQQTNQAFSDEEVFQFFRERFPAFSAGIHYTYNFQGFGEEGHLNIFDKLPREQFPVCVLPWMSFTILWDGKVDYCFVEPKELYYLGDVNHSTITEIWNSPPYREFRRMFIEKRFDEMKAKEIHCGTCSWLFSQKLNSAGTLTMSANKFAPEWDGESPHKTLIDVCATGEEHLLSGYLHYLRGEPGEAFKDFYMASQISPNERIKMKGEEWIEQVKNVFAQKKNIESWENCLQQEGESLHRLHVTRYSHAETDKELEKKKRAAV
ncbi:MAG: radical SAM protein [Candidatus Omnitrophota bacterium]